jgi:Asp-tRNA(Asn)/Glu-tRNA(Gln) amidotransferase A subunit family amidase
LGLQLIGRNYGEAMLFRIAQAYEQAAGWMARRPELGV